MKALRPVSVDHFKQLANDYLPKFISEYIDTGGGSGLSQQRNLAAFDRYTFVPRSLVEVTPVTTDRTIFGRVYSLPFGISAMGNIGFVRRHADQILAETARDANIPFILSGMANASIEEIARLAPDHLWYQYYMPSDQRVAIDVIGRARDAGVSVLVVTVDFPVTPRGSDRRGVSVTTGLDWTMWRVILSDIVSHPRWTFDFLRGGNAPRLEEWARYLPEGSNSLDVRKYFASIWPLNLCWSDLEWIRREWTGKLVIKGLLHPDDTARAFSIGAEAVTISNHGGNKLDCIPASIDLLAEPKPQLAGDATTIFLDSGIRKGSDILIAMALGAKFCFIGRAALYGLAADGARGARRIIEILSSEIEYTQAMIGVSSSDQLSRDMLLQDGRRLERPQNCRREAG
ncbi:alpha-hydroxy acid oxidase [Bradyrhizobium vignae]|uniref:FMN-dependent alpha-hydroxy acid dehydrogenase n=1 Tax=Bradyrhizobium vignae TaxID=1549949 RepID=A0A2U3Q9X7_9BRAD|nr:alpha-hydroxy acid oxidase [Bradyrhizobium vignae]SPP98225.1 FMN-dependent alpha-hydroxy acid dehydrogenase [Bradyrhizobium vignae]